MASSCCFIWVKTLTYLYMKKGLGIFRRKYLVDKKFQVGITSYFLSFYFIVLIALYMFIRFSLNASVEDMKDLDPLNFSTLDLFIDHIISVLNFTFVIFAGIGGVFAFMGGIVMSNKISGPLFRVHSIMQQMIAREYKGAFKVREKDFCADLYSDLEKIENVLQANEKKA